MPSYLQFTKEEIERKGGLHTALEIEGQPVLWQQVYDLILSQKKSLLRFMSPLLADTGLRIILAGAGSSAFIGEAAQGIVQANTKRITQAIATTDLLTHPQLHFIKEMPTLMVSFARSGNSPESLAAVQLANKYCDTVFHLIITCNPDGELLKNDLLNTYELVLPEVANDKSLAMTGSFTGMLLSIILISKIGLLETFLPSLQVLINEATELTGKHLARIKAIAEQPYERVIFLGSGPMLAIARECHLKLQELTDGQVICKHDSFLGFRHGPRAVVNQGTLIVYLLCSDEQVLLYERDLCLSIDADARNTPTISYNHCIKSLKNSVLAITFSEPADPLNELAFISAALIGQLMGFYHSLYRGLRPDSPSKSGTISRVVQGVTIYPDHLLLKSTPGF
ncbi:MAG: sugar isomerase [Ferruginibacter sp.]|uniref:SIS domain-containing protein n=1 Tax=Ferruginibacter sp. TaxID=1940288 RepID=UPI002658F011|nr:SIS domain-containing protein [Ferruginibacter sp.]MDB5280822.1 sugar isomerase [Ferruginibacter sp.]